MNVDEAFKLLELPRTASKDEIEKQYRKLTLKYHPDKGGSSETFNALTEAKDLATIFSENKSLLIIAQDLVIQDLTAIQKTNETNSKISVLINKKGRKLRSRYQTFKDYTLIFAIISGGLTFFYQNQQLNLESYFTSLQNTYWFLSWINFMKLFLYLTIVFSGLFVIFNFITSRLKDKTDEVKDFFENKEDVYEILNQIFLKSNEHSLSRDKIKETIKEVYNMEVTYNFKKNKKNLISIFYYSIFEVLRVLKIYKLYNKIRSLYSHDLKYIISFIGIEDFTKILILKGTSNKLLQEIEVIENNSLEISYKLNTAVKKY